MSTCSQCGANFTCAMTDAVSSEPCWCTTLPPLKRSSYIEDTGAKDATRCFCPQCLRELIALQQKTTAQDV